MNRYNLGFTVAELLIVMAVIGTLAFFMIPNLMAARQTAEEQAAQEFSHNVYNAAQAYLSLSSTKLPNSVDTSNCTVAQNWLADDSVEYGHSPAPNSVFSCLLKGSNSTGIITVTVVSTGGKVYVNGKPAKP